MLFMCVWNENEDKYSIMRFALDNKQKNICLRSKEIDG